MLDIINSFFGQHQQLCKLMSILHQVLYFIYFQSANYFQSTTQLICCSTLVITVTCLVTLVITKTFPVRLQSQNSRQTPTACFYPKRYFYKKIHFLCCLLRHHCRNRRKIFWRFTPPDYWKITFSWIFLEILVLWGKTD